MRPSEFIVLTSFIFTFAWSGMAMSGDYSSKQLAEFVKKKDQCQFAVGQTNMAIQQMAESAQKNEAAWPMNPWILCIDDMTQGRGTIKEKSGCTLYYYNVETGEANMFRRELGTHLMAEKVCGDGGFEELLTLRAPISTPYDKFSNYNYNPNKGMVPVSAWLTDQGHAIFGVFGRVLLHSKKSGWEDWWKSERSKVVSGWEKIIAENKEKAHKENKEKESQQEKELKKSGLESVCYDWQVDRKVQSFSMDDGYSLEVVDKPIAAKKKKVFYILRAKIPTICGGCKSQVGGGLKCPAGFPKPDFL